MRVALTQRVLRSGSEELDCLDQAWSRMLESWGHLPIPVPGNLRRPESVLDLVQPDVLILTGDEDGEATENVANGLSGRERMERRLVAWCEVRHVPVIGICRGMQLLLALHGGHLRDVAGHIGRRHVVSVLETSFTSGGLREVNSFHSHGIESQEIHNPLVPFAWDADGNVEAFFLEDGHGLLMEVGLMWHPERDSVAEWDSFVFNALLRHVDSQNRKRKASSL